MPHASSSGTFARKATGLVREVSPFSTLVFNMAGQPTAIMLAVAVFFTLGAYPGGSIWIGFAGAFVIAIVLCVCFGLLTSAIPRSGGDYVLVSRVLHPALGLTSNFFWLAGCLLTIAFTAQTFVTIAIGPSLTAVGLVSGHNSLVTAGNDLASSKGWQMGIGSAVILVSGLFLAGGWRWTTRLLNLLWGLSFLGLATVLVVLLFKSQGGFISSFNQFAQPITGEPDSYHGLQRIAVSEGISLNPGFSLHNMWPTLAAIAGYSIFGWTSIYIAGEVRRAKDSTQLKMMGLGTFLHLGTAALLSVVFFWKFGHDFFVSINALSGSPKYPFASPPYYSFLTAIAGGSSFLAWFLFITLAVAYPLIIIINVTLLVRSVFAWALDGILPARTAHVSPRTHAPSYAVIIAVVLSIPALWWAISSSSFYAVLAEATLLQFIMMIILSIAGMLLPFRRPEMWRASASTQRFLGIPVISLAGAVAATVIGGLFFIFLHYPAFGVNLGHFIRDCVIVAACALLLFAAARYARSRQGVDVEKLSTEIPPE